MKGSTAEGLEAKSRVQQKNRQNLSAVSALSAVNNSFRKLLSLWSGHRSGMSLAGTGWREAR